MITNADLQAAAAVIEMETQGFLPANGFNSLIAKGFVPNLSDRDQLFEFFPIVMSLGPAKAPAAFPDETSKTGIGAVACLQDRAIFAWMTGTLRLKLGMHQVRYADIGSAEPFRMGDSGPIGIDISEKTSWSLLFAERLNPNLAGSWRDDLLERLTTSPNAA